MANANAEVTSESTTACVDAIHAVADCARTGATSMTQCPTIALVASADPASILPCAIVKRTPQVLKACDFLTSTAEGTSSSSSSSSSSSGSMSDAGDDAPDGL
jgi:hypothetical protein